MMDMDALFKKILDDFLKFFGDLGETKFNDWLV